MNVHVSPDACPALVLNADYRPLSYYPLSLWSWQDAIKAIFLDRVNVLSTYEKTVHSPSFEMKLPSVVCLKSYIKPARNPAFTRFNVFLRDRFTCQYCGSRDDLTFDLTGTWSRDHNQGLGGQCRFVPQSAELNPSTGRTNNPFNAFLPAGYQEACDRSQKYRFASDLDSPIADIESSGVWGIADWRLGEVGPVDLALRYTGSWREQNVRGRSDIDMTPFPVLILAYAGGPPAG